ncbi:hypothetical protein AW736_13110 [Termitidicoccus mucosus]|uniref:Uncharacterized protein n=1 Tax=Termitidicoccus mucosus TaxID=1184151 RepID=A0A178IHB8_9BACT|nr:hypothetical protein AW736_13110 [Opitutaceae bacterium TSB47]
MIDKKCWVSLSVRSVQSLNNFINTASHKSDGVSTVNITIVKFRRVLLPLSMVHSFGIAEQTCNRTTINDNQRATVADDW